MGIGAEQTALKIFKKCAGRSGCEVCRTHLEEDCLFFPELYRLNDQILEKGGELDSKSIQDLLALCTLCGLCPCQDIRMLILEAQSELKEAWGLRLGDKLLSDVESAGSLGSRFPVAANCAGRVPPVSSFVKNILGIHSERDLPVFGKESFFSWAEKKGFCSPPKSQNNVTPKAAYFSGCSAGYLFPEVGKSAVSLFERNGVRVFVPPQRCCSMPLLMEGRKADALESIKTNLKTLLSLSRKGYDIVFSCPTCSYFFRHLLLEKAYYSEAFQDSAGSGNRLLKVPVNGSGKGFVSVPGSIYKKILTDDGYFSSIAPLDRIELSQKVRDAGEYLLSFHNAGRLLHGLRESLPKMIYYAPCHQREQNIGRPYLEILSSLPMVDITPVGSEMDCCGMGGHLGFKKTFHEHSRTVGLSLFEKIEQHKGRIMITDCLSCRLQFDKEIGLEIRHPLELLAGR